MPAAGPQSSRGGLITAVVIFTILFVTATIFAIYFGVDDNKKTEDLASRESRTKQIYSAQQELSPRYQAIIKTLPPGQTVLQIAFQDAQSLAELINGKTSTTNSQPGTAADAARKAIADAAAKVPALQLMPGITLVDAISKLAAYAADQYAFGQSLQSSQAQAAGDAAKQIAEAEELTKKAQGDLAAANQIKQQALDAAQKSANDSVLKIQQMSQDMDQERRQQNAELQKAQQLVEAKDQQLGQETRLATALNDKLAGRRISVVDPLLRQPDGQITSVASDDVVYINLGMGDHLVRGMTFEVYDRREGIPKQDDLMSDDNLPVGKGSIEVEQVYAADSRCRVIKTEIGQQFVEGDLIANLVYDRNTKYNFVIYGNFHLAPIGEAETTDQEKGDAVKIAALVTEWGGHVQKDIDVDTDFVVMGKVPEIQQFTEDELQDPLNRRIQEDEKEEYDAYNAELTKAKELNIPIMNQNRFLYFCGYYDNAQR